VLEQSLDVERHPIGSESYRTTCRRELARTGVLVLARFFTSEAVDRVVDEFAGREPEAFYAGSTHNVWLTQSDTTLAPDHVFNRQIVSTKGLIADDQIGETSPLKTVYADPLFRSFIADVVGLDEVHPYADPMSSVNMHFHRDGEELGWHFDNSAFAVTAPFQLPEEGGVFEYVPSLRDAAADDQNFEGVAAVLDGVRDVERLVLAPGDLVIFRGRDALHRVTPTQGDRTRLLAVFAFNEQPGVRLSDSAMQTFYGRVA
jgi:hypothetical protein